MVEDLACDSLFIFCSSLAEVACSIVVVEWVRLVDSGDWGPAGDLDLLEDWEGSGHLPEDGEG